MSARRLTPPCGTRIDRARELRFTFNGRTISRVSGRYTGFSAVRERRQLIGRSVKLHRPRGITGCGVEEPTGSCGCGSGARRTPNAAPACSKSARSHRGKRELLAQFGFDVAAVNSWFSALLPAGFYYKTFKWPNWHVYGAEHSAPGRLWARIFRSRIRIATRKSRTAQSARCRRGNCRTCCCRHRRPERRRCPAAERLRALGRSVGLSEPIAHGGARQGSATAAGFASRSHAGIRCLRSQLGVRTADHLQRC